MGSMNILVIIFFMWLTGVISSYFHWRKINSKISEFKGNVTGYLGAGISRVNFFRKVMIIVVADNEGKIMDCQYLYGWTTFSKFKPKSDLFGLELDSALEVSRQDKFFDAIKLSIFKVKEQLGEA